MTLPSIGVLVLFLLAAGYWLYGRVVARWLGLDASRTTPAVLRSDGVDYVPTKPFYLTGQHFAAIAAAGPIAGPILAGQQFGWLPCLLWIGAGITRTTLKNLSVRPLLLAVLLWLLLASGSLLAIYWMDL